MVGLAEPIGKTLLDLERNNSCTDRKFSTGRTQKHIYSGLDNISSVFSKLKPTRGHSSKETHIQKLIDAANTRGEFVHWEEQVH